MIRGCYTIENVYAQCCFAALRWSNHGEMLSRTVVHFLQKVFAGNDVDVTVRLYSHRLSVAFFMAFFTASFSNTYLLRSCGSLVMTRRLPSFIPNLKLIRRWVNATRMPRCAGTSCGSWFRRIWRANGNPTAIAARYGFSVPSVRKSIPLAILGSASARSPTFSLIFG